jgi:preprotein translocase subunit SecE
VSEVKVDRPAARPVVTRGPSILERFVRYLREVWAELKRVDWPSRPALIASTIVVVAVLVLLSLYLGAWDFLFGWLFQQVLAK